MIREAIAKNIRDWGGLFVILSPVLVMFISLLVFAALAGECS